MVTTVNRTYRLILSLGLTAALGIVAAAQQQPGSKPFEPVVGQAGKDVVWVPSPEETVQKMLDMAKVTPQDYVIDLGSGDGRNVIAAAKRGALGHGVEYNQDMVDLSKRLAREAGVSDKAQFVQGDMYEADIAKASVLALFLLPDNLNKLRPKFLALRAGSRIVSNTFSIENWEPVQTETLANCTSWCTVMLYIVPANVAGSWQTPQGTLVLEQDAQAVMGALGNNPVSDFSVRGEEVTFAVGTTRYTARVKGDVMEGSSSTGGKNPTSWRATRSGRAAASR
jgi:SAM-dependent methyltransferase